MLLTVHTHIHTRAHTHHRYTYIYTNTHTHTHIYTYTYKYTYTYTYTYTYRTRTHTHTHTHNTTHTHRTVAPTYHRRARTSVSYPRTWCATCLPCLTEKKIDRKNSFKTISHVSFLMRLVHGVSHVFHACPSPFQAKHKEIDMGQGM
jgi:hypothetical protein